MAATVAGGDENFYLHVISMDFPFFGALFFHAISGDRTDVEKSHVVLIGIPSSATISPKFQRSKFVFLSSVHDNLSLL